MPQDNKDEKGVFCFKMAVKVTKGQVCHALNQKMHITRNILFNRKSNHVNFGLLPIQAKHCGTQRGAGWVQSMPIAQLYCIITHQPFQAIRIVSGHSSIFPEPLDDHRAYRYPPLDY